jgi:hypothetical protein
MNPDPRPLVSRKPIVLIVGLCFLVSAVLIPVSLHLNRWIEVELVLAVWWLIWFVVMSWLLYEGHAIQDDAEFARPGIKWGGDFLDSAVSAGDLGCLIGDGCGEAGLAVVGIVLLLIGVALLIEFIFPAIALLLLASIGGMFARAVNDTHDCEGRIGRSLFWAFAWATLYIGPIAAVVIWVSNYLAHRS